MDKQGLSFRQRLIILIVCCVSILMVSLDVTIVNVALPSLQRDLHTQIAGAQWTIDAYTLVLASLFLLAGSTADRIGRKRVFRVGLMVFSVGSLLCSLAPSIDWLIGFRMLQAVGGSMLNPVALSIIDNTFTDFKQRAKAIGAWSAVVGVSMAAGPVIGGALVSWVGWRSIFWLNLPLGLMAIFLVTHFVPESKAPKARRLDPLGQLMVIGFLSSLVYGIIEAPRVGWLSVLILSCFAASLILLVCLIKYEKRRREPLVELKFFRSPPFSGACAIAVGAFIGLGGFLFLNTLYLQNVRNYSAIHAGLFLLPMAAVMMIVSPISGYIVSKQGPRLPLVAGGLSFAMGAGLLALGASAISDPRLFSGYILFGIGLGLLNAAITNTALSGMPRSQAGVVSATNSTSRQVGQSLGVAIIGSILAIHASQVTSGRIFDHNSKIAWWVLCGTALVVVAVAILTTSKWAIATAKRWGTQIAAEDSRTTSAMSN